MPERRLLAIYAGALGALVRVGCRDSPRRVRAIGRLVRFAIAGWVAHGAIVAAVGIVARRELAVHDWNV